MSDVTRPPEYLAAVDLGSNSFHLAIARVIGAGSQLQVIDRVQERIQLAGGLSDNPNLSAAVQERALACLERFSERLRNFPGATVRAVGTDALRVAQNASAFIERCSVALGHPIEVLSGDEEARLIYRGVALSLPPEPAGAARPRELVLDIGGGSTECILGCGLEAEHTASLHMGAVGFTNLYFNDGHITRERFRRAQIAAQLMFERLPAPYHRGDWTRAFGSSGTLLALDDIMRANGWSTNGITKDGLTKLREVLIGAGHAERLQVPGLKPTRATLIAAGAAIARAAFKALPLRLLKSTSAALREGVLDDLISRVTAHDVRESTIQQLAARFHVDAVQAGRVEETALQLFETAHWFGPPGEHGLDCEAAERARRYLVWAARLHEIGVAIGFHGYHKHGAYILANAVLPGFSRDDANVLSKLVLTHRRKLGRDIFQDLPPHLRELALKLAVLVRLAVRLNRNRADRPERAVALEAAAKALTLTLPEGYLAAHPLTQADLDEEAERLQGVGLTLVVR